VAGEYGTGNYGEGPYGGGLLVHADLSPSYNVISHATGNLAPVYSVLPAGTITTVGATLSPIYNLKARVNSNLTASYNVGFITPQALAAEVIEEFDPEELKSFAKRVWGLLAPVQLGSTDLNHYVGGIGELFQEVEDYAADTPTDQGWSILMDVDRIPDKGLDWLAQFVGVTINHDEDARQQVRGHDRWGRGTPMSIIGPAMRWIPGGSTLYMSERNPTPWHITFIMVDKPGPEQTYYDIFQLYSSYHKVRAAYATYQALLDGGRGDWTKVMETLNAAKPAGDQYTFLNTNTILYMAIYILYATYQAVYDAYLTYQDLYSAPFPNINLEIPVYRQLVSTRYYRNIYNQYQTYLEVWDSYVLY
jgi:hypothetical protein